MDKQMFATGLNLPKFGKTMDDYYAIATERKIRNIIHKKRASVTLDTSYQNNPNTKLKSSNLFEVSSHHEKVKNTINQQFFKSKRDEFKVSLLRTQNFQIEEIKTTGNQNISDLDARVKLLYEYIGEVNEEYLKENDVQMVLLHVLDRMRTTIVFCKERRRVFITDLHNKDFTLQNIAKKSVKTKESKYTTQKALAFFKDSVNSETKNLKNEVEVIEKNVEIVKKESLKKLEHNAKEHELTEQIMIEDKCTALKTLRDKFHVHFLWYTVSSAQFEKEKIKLKKYENAFLKIKIATGIQDIPSLVEKYFTRESTYVHFTGVVKVKETQLVEYQEKIRVLQEKIENADKVMFYNENYLEKNGTDLHELQKKVLEVGSKLKKCLSMKNKIIAWIEKVSIKLKGIPRENCEEIKKEKISESIGKISGIVLDYIHKNNLASENARNLIENSKRVKTKMIIESLKPIIGLNKSQLDEKDTAELTHAEE